MTPEKRIESHIKRYVKSTPNSFVVKLHGGAVTGKGYPDLIGSLGGRPFWVEVKASGKPARPEQRLWTERATKCGYVSGVVDSLTSFQQLFEEET